jgi:starch-binding outer membrane protein, SusD/RagB family
MTTIISWHRGRRAAILVACGSLFLGACDVNKELLTPQQPGVISPEAVTTATAADALWAGALGQWQGVMNGGGNNREAIWNWEALFTDELRTTDTFTQRQDADQRNLQSNDAVLTPIYNSAQQARGRARDAINALLAYDQTATGQQHVGEMYLMMGYIEMEMSQAFCNGIPFGETIDGVPTYTAPLTNADGARLAISRMDTAVTFLTGTDAHSLSIKYAALVTKARAQVDIGDFSGAATTVSGVPTNFQYNFTYSQTTRDNEWWVMGTSVKRYSAGDSTDLQGRILNAIPFARLGDPRVKVTDTQTKAEDNVSNFVDVNNWGQDDPIPALSGIDARLIEAEARLQASDIPGMMTILNTLRGSPQVIGAFNVPAMAALPTPGTQAAATDLLFREKALWQFERGYRMDDLRRLVRQYGRTQDNVFPSGVFTILAGPGGSYGTQVAFPVPDYEMVNPNFHGCIDTNA